MGGASASRSATVGRRQRIRQWSKALELAAPGARPGPGVPGNGVVVERAERPGGARREIGIRPDPTWRTERCGGPPSGGSEHRIGITDPFTSTFGWGRDPRGASRRARGAATAGGQGPQRCGTAADEGNPSKGVDRVAGKRARVPVPGGDAARPRSGWCSDPGRSNATNPKAVSGVQQTRGPAAEQSVEVVRDHEDGTGCRGVETPIRR